MYIYMCYYIDILPVAVTPIDVVFTPRESPSGTMSIERLNEKEMSSSRME